MKQSVSAYPVKKRFFMATSRESLGILSNTVTYCVPATFSDKNSASAPEKG
jgi:hypothetical protein